jgi:hypothetical protein
MSYWWCTDHNAVERDGGCRAEVRLGPYATQDAAEHALQSVKERNEKLDAEDEEYENG